MTPRFDADPCETVGQFAVRLARLARESKKPVRGMFIDYEFYAEPGMTSDDVVWDWARSRKEIGRV